LITDGEIFCHEEKRDLDHKVEYTTRRQAAISSISSWIGLGGTLELCQRADATNDLPLGFPYLPVVGALAEFGYCFEWIPY